MSARVLIVDDSLTVRMDLAEAFVEAGFEAALCDTLAGARRSLVAEKADIVVLDLLLPDGDGLELLAELRERPETCELPIILLSSEAEVKDRIRGLQRGANEYVAKPYDAAYVVARARALVRVQAVDGDGQRTILLIDDSLTYREQLGDMLRDAGYRTVTAVSGEDGLRRVADEKPDAIIVDGIMPGMDGTAVIRSIRLDPGLHATPCLLLTASEGAAGEVLALDAGADGYVRKSESPDVVLARLGAMLRSAQQTRERGAVASLMGPKRILAVDDSASFLGQLSEELSDEGYEIVKARSGDEALTLLEIERVDCILLDRMMPGLSGTDTCREIKRSPSLRNIPLIMLTALDERQSMIEGINAGADDYITKSADLGVLKARLRAQLRRKQFEDENRRIRDEMLQKEGETRAAQELAETRSMLLRQLEGKNSELNALNEELEMFAYSVSHDLRQPLRGMDGFSQVLLEEYSEGLDERGQHYLRRIRAGAQRMGSLIDGLLGLSRVGRHQLRRERIDLGPLARSVLERLREAEPARQLELVVAGPMSGEADPDLLETVLENLLGNAWKFTAGVERARVQVGVEASDGQPAYYVKDNGAGFQMDHAEKLFRPFERLHSESHFSGTGIGLATVQRIIHRHAGKIWARAAPGEGATFFFTLGGAAGDGKS